MKAATFFNFYYRFRQSGRFWRSVASLPVSPTVSPLQAEQKIVVVGIGQAALTALEELDRLGFKNVHVVSENERFGGKCVHFGCMPSEAFWLKPESMDKKIDELSRLTEEKFKSWNFKFHLDSAVGVEGKKLILRSGVSLDFDVLLLATGNRTQKPAWLPSSLPPENFWRLKKGHLVIVNQGEPAAWSYADMAVNRGLSCTLVQTQQTFLDPLPSFAYFNRQIRKNGVRFFSDATPVPGDGEKKLSIRSDGKFHQIPYDEILFVGPSELKLPAIDGGIPDIFSLDLQTSRLKTRPDIYAIGDAGGFLSAAEAELKALQTVWRMTGQNAPVTLEALSKLPLRLHSKQSWASTGDAASFTRTKWQEVDFKMLGWSLLHEQEGKLWYGFDPDQKTIQAIHICHSQAGELIALASGLISLPVTDARWLTSSVHPGAAEIFKYMILDIRRRFPWIFRAAEAPPLPIRLHLPPPGRLRDGSDIFNGVEIQRAFLETDPWLYLALSLVARHEGENTKPIYNPDSRKYAFEGKTDFSYHAEENGVQVRWGNRIYEIRS